MMHSITKAELESDPWMHGTINSLQTAAVLYARLITLDGKLPERVMARLAVGELRDIQIISTDDRIVVQLAID